MKWLALALLAGCAHGKDLGELVVRVTPPDARVRLDDHDIGSGAMIKDRALRLHPGLRRIEVDADGFYSARREATVVAKQRSTIDIELRAIPDGMKP